MTTGVRHQPGAGLGRCQRCTKARRCATRNGDPDGRAAETIGVASCNPQATLGVGPNGTRAMERPRLSTRRDPARCARADDSRRLDADDHEVARDAEGVESAHEPGAPFLIQYAVMNAVQDFILVARDQVGPAENARRIEVVEPIHELGEVPARWATGSRRQSLQARSQPDRLKGHPAACCPDAGPASRRARGRGSLQAPRNP